MTQHTWQWWHSHDGGERYHGPCASREDAISDGRDYADGESFIICEATKGSLRAFISERVGEWLDENNEELGDPDGDPISANITTAQWQDLQTRLDATALEWIKAHNLDRHVFTFDETRNEEDIEGVDDAEVR
jgi:hypothetical protein